MPKALGADVPSQNDLAEKYGHDVEWLERDHENVIEKILEEEEKLINNHR